MMARAARCVLKNISNSQMLLLISRPIEVWPGGHNEEKSHFKLMNVIQSCEEVCEDRFRV